MSVYLRTVAVSDRGKARENNEDAVHAGPGLIAVADGVGGGPSGEVASEIDHLCGVYPCGCRTWKPGLHRPGKWVTGPGITQRDQLGSRERRATYQFAGRCRLGLQPSTRRLDVVSP
jgi:serine/threonine protein phosphatase PrpC